MNRKLPRPRVDLKCKPFTYKVSKKILWPSRLGIHVICKKVVVQTHLQLLEFSIQTAFLTMTPSEYVKVHVYLYLPTFWQKCALNRSSRSEVFCKKGGLRNFVKFTGKHLCQSLFFNEGPQACNFIKKETPAQMFPCESFETFINNFFTKHLSMTASSCL